MTAIHRPHDPTVPKGALIATGVLVLGVLTVTAGLRIAQVPPAASPVLERAAERVAPLAARTLTFADQANGGVMIRDVATGAVVKEIEPGDQAGFIRGVMRGLARDRKMRGIGAEPPFTLTAWQNGQLSLVDGATGRTIELSGFGDSNRAAFMALLSAPETAQ